MLPFLMITTLEKDGDIEAFYNEILDTISTNFTPIKPKPYLYLE